MYYYLNLENILNRGVPVSSRAGGALEWVNLKTQVASYDLPRRPKMRRELGYMELCQFLSGIYEPTLIARVAPNIDMELFGRSAIYGPRVMPRQSDYSEFAKVGRDQLADVIEELQNSPSSRRAVITISAPDEPLSDQPCISMLQFQLRGHQVHMSVYARSWDMWFGAPHDLIVLSGILQVVASCLAVQAGMITVTAGNGHIYERSVRDVGDAVALSKGGGSYLSWNFSLPNYGDLRNFRVWADAACWDTNWLSGPPKGVVEKWASPNKSFDMAKSKSGHEEVPILEPGTEDVSKVVDAARRIFQNKGNL